MSLVKTNAILDASGGTTATINGYTPTMSNMATGNNRIINGAMMIDQRNAGASVTMTNPGTYDADRWYCTNSSDGVMTAQQVSDAPAGFVNSLKCTTTTADAALGTSQRAVVAQFIEGFNTADLAWGSASAATITLSFWVKSTLTGTFGGALRNSAADRSYPFTYTINSANTWEQKTVTVAGDTTGTWLKDNGTGIGVHFGLGVASNLSGTAGAWAAANNISATGAVSVLGTLNATWQITGVQLEAGSVATPFDFRQYGQELALCQRYFETSFNIGTAPADGVESGDRKQGVAYSAADIGYYSTFKVQKRTNPTLVLYKGANTGTNGQWSYYSGAAWVAMTSGSTSIKESHFRIDFSASGRTFGQALLLDGNFTASAEL